MILKKKKKSLFLCRNSGYRFKMALATKRDEYSTISYGFEAAHLFTSPRRVWCVQPTWNVPYAITFTDSQSIIQYIPPTTGDGSSTM